MCINKDENVHRFALSAIRGKLLERKRERDIFGILYKGYLLSIVKIKKERERERESEREREREREKEKGNCLIYRDLLNSNIKKE